MHYLHKILVNVKRQTGEDKIERQELIHQIRAYAEQETECFYEHAFDWRETDTAGRWQDMYPENVILGVDSPEKILAEVIECRNQQKAEIDACLTMMEGYASMPFSDLAQIIWKRIETPMEESESLSDHLVAFNIKKISRLLDGEYYYDSFFYDTDEYTAQISQTTIQKIKEHPEDWALVFFDQHF